MVLLPSSNYSTKWCGQVWLTAADSMPLGYNKINNFCALTRWWLHNKILRHIYKKGFPFFELCFASFLRVRLQIWKKKIYDKNFFINQERYQKHRISRWFQIHWEVLKNFKKSYLQKCNGNMPLFHFYSCSSNLFWL